MKISSEINGRTVVLDVPGERRLADLLREDLGLTGTKIGCNAGDCGACTVLLDGEQVCACLVPAARIDGGTVVTVEGLGPELAARFLLHGAAQCGFCTPGMLVAATSLLNANPAPDEAEVMDALGGVLCRCTGYRKIIDAILDRPVADDPRHIAKVDGPALVTGTARFGADEMPDDVLHVRMIRSPHPHARFALGDLDSIRGTPGLHLLLTAADVPGSNTYGIYPTGKDQFVLAEGYVRHRGEPVCALVGTAEAVQTDVPIAWEVLPPVAMGEGPDLHPHTPGNILIRGRVARGDTAQGDIRAAIAVETGFVEHAYIEPEAGYARRVGETIEIVATTQTPYMDRDEIALILGIPPERVRIIPTAVGGGFGGKLDLSVQPLIAIAAWRTGRPCRLVYTRAESMRASTKRHPSRITAEAAMDNEGRLLSYCCHADFDTGAYASWGPTVANRVPVHATGPYRVPNVLCTSAAIHSTNPPAGAFRGFGVPQVALAGEALLDMLAARLGIDPWEIRRINTLRPGDASGTGQVMGQGAALVECLDALHPAYLAMRAQRQTEGSIRRGVGVACMWYGIGNTSMSNPSEMVIGIDAAGRCVLFSGAVDIGQGSNTVMTQIAAAALGVPPEDVGLVAGDTARTRDAGKTSASRQTYVSGTAVRLAAEALRAEILRRANAGADAAIVLAGGKILINGLVLDPAAMKPDAEGLVLRGEGRFDPPTTPLDADGQGEPYACYAFAAQAALVEVDTALGTVRVLKIAAAHDVGRAVNPTLVEGQIHGGIAQGLGLALMEEYLPGRTENLHDYLIPTIGDVPEIEVFLVETEDGPKGVGEPALVATAPAILNAIADATGARLTRVPATPERVLEALRA